MSLINIRAVTVRRWVMGLSLALLASLVRAEDFDHQHAAWNALLQAHVVWVRGGVASEVNYADFVADRSKLAAYLDTLSGVTEAEYQAWSASQRLAFLINAYNAFTVDLILDAYPDLESIKDLGGLFSSPWRNTFFSLRGQQRSLDEVEHDMIRVEFVEPRIHMAVNCASIGCPALADSAYVADQLDAQLTRAVNRFMADQSRNRYVGAAKTFEVSSIFKWYGDDWNARSGYPGGVREFLMAHLERLSAGATPPALVVKGADIEYLDYDWALNDVSQATE
ncbi:DUF547 domain-containing protein [Marinobacter caseinilyticus]|uniref:DUF547 domain-containing protein n=1 Tax=Marinobacter caseinilyticus TaxID=2692195 RepID=UPI001A9476CA|nr:DUF547 domain-containing protein [Marinobacter caseinilyticus]